MSKKVMREYKKAFQEKTKKPKRQNRRTAEHPVKEENDTRSLQQIFEITLRRLHVLGNQRFGSSPFGEYFERWLRSVESVLNEFETHPDMDVDEQFTEEHKQTLTTIKRQLESHRQREKICETQINSLSDAKSRLQQVNMEYFTKELILRNQKAATLNRLSEETEALKKEQEEVIKLKTGFFRGISKKEREQKENWIVQRYNGKQQEIEMTTLNFKEKQKQLRDELENKRDTLQEDIKKVQKYTKEIEEDHSLEDRWFTCETLKDIVNNFFQRKISTPPSTIKKSKL